MFLNPDLNILISLVAMYTNYVFYKTFNICNYMHEYRFIEVLHVAYCFSSYCICSFFAQIWVINILLYSVSDIETSKYMAITAKASNNTKHRLKFRLFL